MKHTIVAHDEYDYPIHMMGYASTLPADRDDDDVIARLREVVKEVTGKAVEDVPKPRIGFLP